MEQQRHIDTIFFDLDNTLWWFDRNSVVSLRNTFDRYHLDEFSDFDTFYRTYERHNTALWERFSLGLIEKDYLVNERFRHTLADLHRAGDNTAFAAELNEFYLNDLAHQPYLNDGARETLEELAARGFRLCILSNGFAGIQQGKLASSGIDHLFAHVVLSDDCGITKPLPGIYEYAARVTGCRPETTAMVGDSYSTDIVGAHNAGWATVLFNPANDTPQGDADVKITHLLELLDIFC